MSEHLYAQVLSRPSSDTDQAQTQTRPALGFTGFPWAWGAGVGSWGTCLGMGR